MNAVENVAGLVEEYDTLFREVRGRSADSLERKLGARCRMDAGRGSSSAPAGEGLRLLHAPKRPGDLSFIVANSREFLWNLYQYSIAAAFTVDSFVICIEQFEYVTTPRPSLVGSRKNCAVGNE